MARGGTCTSLIPSDPSLDRIAVVGTSCSGKTTFARELATLLGSQHVELDALHWGPNWTPSVRLDFQRRVSVALSDRRWVCCGNYFSLGDLVLGRATAVIWLNYSFRIIFWRALRRTIRRIVTREMLFGGNRETFKQAFLSRDSILWWVVSSHSQRIRKNRALFNGVAYTDLRRIELLTPADAKAFLARLQV